MRFFVDRVVAAGWTYTSSTIAKTVTLNFQRNGRRATIWIYGQDAGGGGFLGLGGGGGDGLQVGPSRVTIAVNHADAIEEQGPFRDLPALVPAEPIAPPPASSTLVPPAASPAGAAQPALAAASTATQPGLVAR
jgi:hypothetical protein